MPDRKGCNRFLESRTLEMRGLNYTPRHSQASPNAVAHIVIIIVSLGQKLSANFYNPRLINYL